MLDAHDERMPERRTVDLGQVSQLGGLSVVGLPQGQRGGVHLEVDDAGVVGDECLPILGRGGEDLVFEGLAQRRRRGECSGLTRVRSDSRR